MIDAGIAGLIMGLLAAVFAGSEAILVLENATGAGLRQGLAAGAGVATAAGLWAVAFSLFDVVAAAFRDHWSGFWKWVAVVGLLLVGGSVVRNQISHRLIPYGLIHESEPASRHYLGFLARSLIDPVTAIFFISLTVGPDSGHSPAEAIVFVVCVFLGSLCWQAFLTVMGARRSDPFSPKARRRLRWADCVLLSIFTAYIALAT